MKSVQDIYYTPKLKQKLLSVGHLCEKSYRVVFENMKYTIYDKNQKNKLITVVPKE